MSEAIWSKAADLIDPRVIRDFLKANPDYVRNDPELLEALGLRIDAANVVDFGPAALTRVAAAHKREAGARKQLEATARANFAAQAQTHAAVIDILEARNHSDLARRVDELSTLRFGLVGATIAIEVGAERAPASRLWAAATRVSAAGPKSTTLAASMRRPSASSSSGSLRM